MAYVHNPVRRGFYPDPSVCRAEEFYYCVHSSFGYAPGIPIFRSSNLIEWEQIGHALVTAKQLRLEDTAISGGIYAPTIRYHKGIFYIIVTNVTHGGNFYITANEPAGPWSEPYYLEGAEGIDPSLYFEGEHCYYVGQRQKRNAAYIGDCEIWMQELDLEKHCLTGRECVLWDGAMKRTWWPEGPHLYKKDGYYYLLIAESGTEYNHSITIARSRELEGPYEGCPANPIFTHRHLGRKYPVQNVGHGDLVQGRCGDWYLFMLGTRPLDGCAELGRETFAADVVWEEGWPVINAGEGRLRKWQKIREPEPIERKSGATGTGYHVPVHPLEESDLGTMREYVVRWTQPLDCRLVSLRKFLPNWPAGSWRIENDMLYLKTRGDSLSGTGIPAYLGVRMEERSFRLRVNMNVSGIKEGEELGLALFYDERNHIRAAVEPVRRGDLQPALMSGQCGGCQSAAKPERQCGFRAVVTVRKNGEEYTAVRQILEVPDKKGMVELRLGGENQKLAVYVQGTAILQGLDIRFLCSEMAGGFTGCTMGIYAAGCGGGEAAFGPLQVQYGYRS